MRNPLSVATLAAAWSLVTSCLAFDTASLPSLDPRQVVDRQTNQSATFFYAPHDDHSTNFTFSIRYVQDTEDILFRLQCPDVYSWVAVGFGRVMSGSLMFVFYPNDAGTALVYSPRISSGHSEPTYTDRITLEHAHANEDPREGIYDGTWNIAGICRNCTRSLGVGTGVDRIDFAGWDDMIYAFGPRNDYTQSDALDAPMRRHTAYGHFSVNFGDASVTTPDNDLAKSVGVPPLGNATDNARMDGDIHNDHEPTSPLHAAVMCLAFLVMFPLGTIAARVFNKVKLHAAFQGLGLLLVLVGMVVGIYMSKYYNRSKHISNGHQIFGLVIVAVLLVQWAAGFAHHRHFVKHGAPLKNGYVVAAHRILGPLVMAAGIVNGAFGFRFALTHLNTFYVPIVITIAVLVIIAIAIKALFHRRNAGPKSSGVEGLAQSAGYAQPVMQPPAYPAQPAPPYNASQPYGEPQPYTGYNAGTPYGNSNWDKSDIALQTLEPQHPKPMV